MDTNAIEKATDDSVKAEKRLLNLCTTETEILTVCSFQNKEILNMLVVAFMLTSTALASNLLSTIPVNSSLSASNAVNSESDDSSIESSIEEIDVKLYFQAESEYYFFSDRYTVELWLDDNMLGEIPNGEKLATLVQTKSGVHSIIVYKKGNHSISFGKEINVTKDLSLSFLIEHEDAIKLLKYKESDLPDIEMPDIKGMTFTEANNTLKNAGFTNISSIYATEAKLKSTDNWIVTGSNCEPGYMYKSMELIEVSYSIKEIPMIDTVGMTYREAVDKLRSLGFENIVQNKEADIDDIENTEWKITEQNYKAKTVLSANEKIILDCSVITITTATSTEFNDLLFSSEDIHLKSSVFVQNNKGRIIEFYAIVLSVDPYKGYSTRYNVSITNSDSGEETFLNSAIFLFENVAFNNMHVVGTDSVKMGKRFLVYARIDGYDATNEVIVLKPIKMQYITDKSLSNRVNAIENVKTSENNKIQAEEIINYEHIIDFAYVRRFKLYSLYYAFDIETETAIYFSDDDKSVQRLKYTGDLQNGITVLWSAGEDRWIETLKVSYDKQHAYLKISDDPSTYELIECTPAEVESIITGYGFEVKELVQPKEKTVSITTGCNIREQPSFEAKAIRWVNIGETYPLIEEKNGWYEIKVESNKTGYIPADRAKVVD